MRVIDSVVPFPELYSLERKVFTKHLEMRKLPIDRSEYVNVFNITRHNIAQCVPVWKKHLKHINDLANKRGKEVIDAWNDDKKISEINAKYHETTQLISRHQKLEDEAMLFFFYSLFKLSGSNVYDFTFNMQAQDISRVNRQIKNRIESIPTIDFDFGQKEIVNETFYIELKGNPEESPYIQLPAEYLKRFGDKTPLNNSATPIGWYVTVLNNKKNLTLEVLAVFRNTTNHSKNITKDRNILVDHFSFEYDKLMDTMLVVYSEVDDFNFEEREIKLETMVNKIVKGKLSDYEYCRLTLIANSLSAIIPIVNSKYSATNLPLTVKQIYNRLTTDEKTEIISHAINEMMSILSDNKYDIIHKLDGLDQITLLSVLTDSSNQAIEIQNQFGEKLYQSYDFTIDEQRATGKELLRFSTKDEGEIENIAKPKVNKRRKRKAAARR